MTGVSNVSWDWVSPSNQILNKEQYGVDLRDIDVEESDTTLTPARVPLGH